MLSYLVAHVPQSLTIPVFLVLAGHTCYTKLQADNSWLFFDQITVIRPFQFSITLLPALGATAALYCPLCICALSGLLTHLLLLILFLVTLHFFVVDGRSQNEGVGTWREAVGVGELISCGRRCGGVGCCNRDYTKLLQPLNDTSVK